MLQNPPLRQAAKRCATFCVNETAEKKQKINQKKYKICQTVIVNIAELKVQAFQV